LTTFSASQNKGAFLRRAAFFWVYVHVLFFFSWGSLIPSSYAHPLLGASEFRRRGVLPRCGSAVVRRVLSFFGLFWLLSAVVAQTGIGRAAGPHRISGSSDHRISGSADQRRGRELPRKSRGQTNNGPLKQRGITQSLSAGPKLVLRAFVLVCP